MQALETELHIYICMKDQDQIFSYNFLKGEILQGNQRRIFMLVFKIHRDTVREARRYFKRKQISPFKVWSSTRTPVIHYISFFLVPEIWTLIREVILCVWESVQNLNSLAINDGHLRNINGETLKTMLFCFFT